VCSSLVPTPHTSLQGEEAAAHTVSAVVVQAVSTPSAPPHVASAAQLVHGVLPDVDHDVPATHGTLHAVSVVVVQAVSTPSAFPHVLLAEQIVHGVKPDTDHVEPTTHGAA
jgi:hypothetical protein